MDLVAVMEQARLIDDSEEANIKLEAIESLVLMLEAHPDLLENNDVGLNKILELNFLNMMDINMNNIEEWSKPEDGFNDDLVQDDDQKLVK